MWTTKTCKQWLTWYTLWAFRFSSYSRPSRVLSAWSWPPVHSSSSVRCPVCLAPSSAPWSACLVPVCRRWRACPLPPSSGGIPSPKTSISQSVNMQKLCDDSLCIRVDRSHFSANHMNKISGATYLLHKLTQIPFGNSPFSVLLTDLILLQVHVSSLALWFLLNHLLKLLPFLLNFLKFIFQLINLKAEKKRQVKIQFKSLILLYLTTSGKEHSRELTVFSLTEHSLNNMKPSREIPLYRTKYYASTPSSFKKHTLKNRTSLIGKDWALKNLIPFQGIFTVLAVIQAYHHKVTVAHIILF